MPNPARVVKVLATLLASMTIGAIVLMTMGHNPPSAGPFSLWSYECLDPVKEMISSAASQSKERWEEIEICYSGTKSGNLNQLATFHGFSNPQDLNYHFCVYNGQGGNDGQIQPTEKWQNQHSAQNRNGRDKAIRICVVADGRNVRPTDCQIKRIQVLIEELSRSFDINPDFIAYPNNWR